jgi:hypothetical protein
MESETTLTLFHFIRTAARFDRLAGSGLRDAALEFVKKNGLDNCDTLYSKFKGHLERAGNDRELDLDSEPDPAEGPIPFGDTPGYYWRFMVTPKVKLVPNTDARAAAAILELARQLGCDWSDRARAQLEEKLKVHYDFIIPPLQ